jgi:hypothetical protein
MNGRSSSIKRADRARLYALVKNTIKIKDLRTTASTAKMWIAPTGNVIPLLTYHYEYFRDHPGEAVRYGVHFADEITTRLEALRKGFVRVNYERKMGRLTIEAGAKGWTHPAIDVIFMLIAVNREAIDCLNIAVLSETGGIIQSGQSLIFSYTEKEKISHIPLISETAQGQELVEWLAKIENH